MKRILKENKILFVLAIIIIIAIGVMAYGLVRYFYGNDKESYGDRLSGIENYEISETIEEDIKSLYESGVDKVSVNIQGKIIYITLNVENGVNKMDAQNYAATALTKFSEEELNFYDVQFFITCKEEENEEKTYPIEGYKNSSSPSIVW